MAGRDDFGSGARSPGGWGGQGNMQTAAGQGGHGSLGGAAGRNGSGMGGLGGVGGGAGYSIRPEAAPYISRAKGPWPGGYATPVLKKPIATVNPVVAALSRRPAVTQEDQPYTGALPGEPSYTPQRYINPGAGVDPNGIGRTYSNISVPQGYATSNPAVFSGPGAPGGLSSYRNMGRAMQSGATPQRYGPEGVKSW